MDYTVYRIDFKHGCSQRFESITDYIALNARVQFVCKVGVSALSNKVNISNRECVSRLQDIVWLRRFVHGLAICLFVVVVLFYLFFLVMSHI